LQKYIEKKAEAVQSLNILVVPSYYPDSINTNLGSFIKQQCETLSEYGYSISVVYVEQRSLRSLNIKSLIKYHYQREIIKSGRILEYVQHGWNIPGPVGKIIWNFLSLRLISKYLSLNRQPDIVHAHNIFSAGILVCKHKALSSIPFIITEHDSSFIMNKYSQRKVMISTKYFSRFDFILPVSSHLKGTIEKRLPNSMERIVAVPNIVDVEYYKPQTNIARSKRKVKFISIGNLNKNKNHQLLIKSFSQLIKIDSSVTLRICGDGPEYSHLRALIDLYGVADYIRMEGHLNSDSIRDHLQEADCLVHTSDHETFGIVLIEALSSGIPFIATSSGGPDEIYRPGYGYIIDPNNVEALTMAMHKMIDDQSIYSGNILRQHAIDQYSQKAFTEKIDIIYSQLVPRKRK
jgi:L-malate glycosyltransferase